jgi:tetratricopeptide (TPR) repeat protein
VDRIPVIRSGHCSFGLAGAWLLGLACLLPAGTLAAAEPQAEASVQVPDPSEVFCQRADLYLERFKRDDMGQALRLFRQVMKDDPGNPRGHAGFAEARAIQYLFGWDPDPDTLKKGVESGKKAVELGPDSPQAHIGLGLALAASEQFTPALAELDRAVKLAPESGRAHLYRGMILRGMRRTEEAIDEANRTVGLAPSWPVGSALLGDCKQDLRRYHEAIACYLMAARLDQDLLWARLGLAAANQRETNLPAAEKTYLLTERDFPEDTTRIRILAAALLVASQRYDDAVAMYQAMTEKEVVSPPLYRRLMLAGRAYSLEKLDRPEESEYFWNKVVEEFPPQFDGGFRDREVAAQAFESLARIYQAKGDSKRALETLEKGCRNEGMGTGLYAALAEMFRSAGRMEEAVDALARGLKATVPDEDWVLTTKKYLPTLKSVAAPGTPQKVRAAGIDVLHGLADLVGKEAPDSFVPYLNLARAESQFHETSPAIEHLGAAVKKGYGGLASAPSDPDFKLLAGEPAFKSLLQNPPQ